MIFSESWLKEWVNPKVNREDLLQQLTMAGLEVEKTVPAAPYFTGVIVGEVVACEQHPNADKLKLTRVSVGNDEVQVVCGAPNVRVGLKAPFAKVDALLPEDFKIKPTAIRGIESYGMLCSDQELGMNFAEQDGLMELPADAPIGMDIREYLNLDDISIEIGLTPNRADCLSLIGIAREVSANYNIPVTEPRYEAVTETSTRKFNIAVEAKKACPRFVGRVIENININVSTPLWLKLCLQRAGIRPVDPVVDVTNYVMLELGQPMHGYDLEQLSGGINVRFAKEAENLVLLDGSKHNLSSDTLLITDHEKVLGLAGIMGGQQTGINKQTQHIFLEAAFFDPTTMAGIARRYGLHTEASHRFERGVDFKLQTTAIERASALIIAICGGNAGPITEVVTTDFLPQRPSIHLRKSKVSALLGLDIDNTAIESMLSNLGLQCQAVAENEWKVTVPGWRFDMAIEEDLIEEIVRIYGYDKLPESLCSCHNEMLSFSEAENLLQQLQIKQILVSRGYHETINFSLTDPLWQQAFDSQTKAIKVQNPISTEMAVMRTSLLPGLLKALVYNQKRQHTRIRLFEEGQTFIRENNKTIQKNWLGAIICGPLMPEGWSCGQNRLCDFYDIKGDLEALLKTARHDSDFSFVKSTQTGMHPGQTAKIVKNNHCIGYIGAVHPGVLKQLDIKGPVFTFEIEKSALATVTVTKFMPLSKYPGIRRDMAIVVDYSVSAEAVINLIKQNAGQWLKDICLFDVYSGEGIEQGKKNLALGLTWKHSSRTLKDDEIDKLFDNLVNILEVKLQAILRFQ